MHPHREQLRDFLLALEAASRQFRTEVQGHPTCPNLSQPEVHFMGALNGAVGLTVTQCLTMLPIQA